MSPNADLLDDILKKYVNSEGGSAKTLHTAGFIVKNSNGQTLYSNAFGKLSLDDDSAPFTTDSVCFVASLTKLVTAVCAMQLVEKGLIGLDDDVGKVVRELSNLEILKEFDDDGEAILVKKTNPITLRNLLTHSSGFCYDKFDLEMVKWSASIGRTVDWESKTIEGFTFPLKFEPGSSWMYGAGSDWAAIVVETLSGSTLEDYCQKCIFKPLGLSSSTFLISQHPQLASRRASVVFRSPAEGTFQSGDDPGPHNPKQISGGSGLYTTAEDYAKLLGALVSNDARMLKPESIKELFRPQLSNPGVLQAFCDGPSHNVFCPEFPRGLPVDYALGGMVNLKDVPGKRRKGSMMWSGYTNPRWWIDIETGIAATLFTQTLPPGDGVVATLYDELEKTVYQSIIKEE